MSTLDSRIVPVASLALALATACATAASAGTLEGRWLLVEQTVGSGQANQVEPGRTLHVEFVRQGGRLVGRTWIGDDPEAAARWPSPLTGDAVAIRVEEIAVTRDEHGVVARYRTEPAPGASAIEFVEEYRLGDDGTTLVGTVKVSQIRGDEPVGSYVLHRVFERER